MKPVNVVAFVMAGGAGERLRPLTSELPKPALPFAGGYKIIDFALSNLYNSGIRSTFVLLQYKPRPLLDHLTQSWAFANTSRPQFIRPLMPPNDGASSHFMGTADAVRQTFDILDGFDASHVAVFAADHIYRMDVRQMLSVHEDNHADATIAAVSVSVQEATAYGIMAAQPDGRITRFQEKPALPQPLDDDPDHCLASMGNYLFRRDVLSDALADAARRGEHDFGRDVLPRLIAGSRVHAYDHSRHTVPGTRPCEEQGYWRDVGTVEAYVAAHWDLLGAEPRFCLDNPLWPLLPPTSTPHTADGPRVHRSIIGPDGRFAGAALRNSVLQRDVHVDAEATLEHCVVMSGARIKRGARLRHAVIGPGATLEAGVAIGHDMSVDRQRYTVTPGGMVVVPPQAINPVAHARAEHA